MTAKTPRDLSKVVLRGELVNNVAIPRGVRKGVGNHLQPGVVKYDNDDGTSTTYLLPLDAIERMRPTAKGVPIVGASQNYDHVKVEPGKDYDGKVSDSYWDGDLGWERANFEITNPENVEGIQAGYQFSCAYVPTEVDETPGKWHNVPYDAVIKNGRYTHIAIVPEPRYDGATIELKNALKKNGGLLKNTLKTMLAAVIPAKELKELANAMEADERDAARAKAKSDFDNAMKNAQTDEEKSAAKIAYANAMIAADEPGAADDPIKKAKEQQSAERANKVKALRNAAAALSDLHPDKSKLMNDEADKLEKLPLGGGDVTPEPGVTSSQTGAPSEAPEAKAERERKEADARNAADAAKSTQDKAKAEKDREEAENKNAADAWAHFSPEMVEAEVADKVLVNSGRILGFVAQRPEVQKAWAAAVTGAKGATVAEKVSHLTAKAVAAIELQNALKEEKARKAAVERQKDERFNSLRDAAAMRGSSGITPGSLTGDSMEDRIALGRELYGSHA